MLEYGAILMLGLVAGTVGGILGFGSAIMLLPALVIVFGPREAVPIMAVGSIMANASRVWVWRRELDWKLVATYSATGIPAAALGARTLLQLPSSWIEILLGTFFIAMIGLRRWMARQPWHMRLWHMAVVGALIGFVTTGPINAPFFIAYGLIKGAYIGTEALGSLAVFLSKAATFHAFGALHATTALKGLLVGSSLVAGSLTAKRLLDHIRPEQFRQLIDLMLLVAGLTMYWAAWQGT
jgi:uncharacterized protein